MSHKFCRGGGRRLRPDSASELPGQAQHQRPYYWPGVYGQDIGGIR